jgi:polyketide cyclase/dehydrase/lipid transport protein
MLKIILIALAVIAVVLVVVIVMQPGEFRVARSATIAAPPPVVFAQVNDFHKWAWNPWGKIDPAMQQSYEGAPFGTGAVYSWAGNKDVGAGRMTIIESRPSELIRIKMEFFKPFAATDTAEFTFTPESNQTAVTWSMSGINNFFAKAFHLFINMDKMIGDQFVKGLTDMKSQVEAAAK